MKKYVVLDLVYNKYYKKTSYGGGGIFHATKFDSYREAEDIALACKNTCQIVTIYE